MDPAARLWETWNYAPAEKAEQPQDHQDYNNSPQHEIFPFWAICPLSHPTTNTPQSHPSAGECSPPLLGGDIYFTRFMSD